jgi:hypothetical protein
MSPHFHGFAPDDDHYWDLVYRIDSEGQGLSSWEIDFIDNLLGNEDVIDSLSMRQKDKITQIWNERVA